MWGGLGFSLVGTKQVTAGLITHKEKALGCSSAFFPGAITSGAEAMQAPICPGLNIFGNTGVPRHIELTEFSATLTQAIVLFQAIIINLHCVLNYSY